MNILGSLRRRLVAGMLLVFGAGLTLAAIAHLLLGGSRYIRYLNIDLLREPYQDFTVLLLFTVIMIGSTLIVIGWSLRGLRAASQEAARVGPRNPQARIDMRRLPDEIQPMVAAVNDALDRMAQAFDMERRFVADAAHELRTPLTVLSLRLQQARLSQTPDWHQIECDLAQVSRVVSQLLDLARKEVSGRGIKQNLDIVDVGRVAREAAAGILPLADKAKRQIALELPERLRTRGQAGELRDMFRNLLENALIHGEGVIRITGRIWRENEGSSELLITVADEGTRLSSANREVLFERFCKMDASSSGSGLGLPIVREIVRAHGGSVKFAPGSKTVIQIRLPAVRDQFQTLCHAGGIGRMQVC